MFHMLRCVIGLVSLLVVANANASLVYGRLGTLIMKPDYALITLTMVAPAGSCNASLPPQVGQYKVIMSQTTGNALVQQLLHAQERGYGIWLVGTGSCDQAGRETVDFIQVYYE
jgi:hypothetical protein